MFDDGKMHGSIKHCISGLSVCIHWKIGVNGLFAFNLSLLFFFFIAIFFLFFLDLIFQPHRITYAHTTYNPIPPWDDLYSIYFFFLWMHWQDHHPSILSGCHGLYIHWNTGKPMAGESALLCLWGTAHTVFPLFWSRLASLSSSSFSSSSGNIHFYQLHAHKLYPIILVTKMTLPWQEVLNILSTTVEIIWYFHTLF